MNDPSGAGEDRLWAICQDPLAASLRKLLVSSVMRVQTGSRTLVSNPAMLKELLDCCKERVALGQNDLQTITDRLENLSETDRASAYYHCECLNRLLTRQKIYRLRLREPDFNKPWLLSARTRTSTAE
ncbi:hypothetical protein GWK47_017203 [Chionoecetes opilio]|uniref:Uncharacterized protein n=1 Tax=Chionoecetes opilio TaxID=41210 RepID=A0A8J4XST5_CHIOP|nr:hypothetical protein GWK47_017203 [Chionoecetes opilio]